MCIFNFVFIADINKTHDILPLKPCAELRVPSMFSITANSARVIQVRQKRTATHDGALNWLKEMTGIFGRRKLIIFDYHVDIDISGDIAGAWIRELRRRNIDIAEIYVVRPKWDYIGLYIEIYRLAQRLNVYIVLGAEKLSAELSGEEVFVSYDVDYINDGSRPGRITEDIISREVSNDAEALKARNIKILALHLTANGEKVSGTSTRIMEAVESQFMASDNRVAVSDLELRYYGMAFEKLHRICQ